LPSRRGKAFAEKFFGDWKNEGATPNETTSREQETWKPENVVIDMPEAAGRGDRGRNDDQARLAGITMRAL
jgi:hypothetical protein